MKDLVVLVADLDMKEVLKEILNRHQSLGLNREISFDIFNHPHRDPGCRTEADNFLKSLRSQYRYALVVFDYEGCSAGRLSPDVISQEVRHKIEETGWKNQVEVIVIQPELEIWVWSDSPHVEECLGWKGSNPSLREWLKQHGLQKSEELKPSLPKEAMEKALRQVNKSRSAAIYRQLAKKLSFQRCSNPAFMQLLATLRKWFNNSD
jgi:hypothetical protein